MGRRPKSRQGMIPLDPALGKGHMPPRKWNLQASSLRYPPLALKRGRVVPGVDNDLSLRTTSDNSFRELRIFRPRALQFALCTLFMPAQALFGGISMAHKKIERKKELDRRRKRRAERIKARIRDAKAAPKA